MKNKLFLFLIFIELGIIVAGLLIYPLVFKVEARLEFRTSPEVGREIVVFFNQPIIQSSFEKRFRFEPRIKGKFVWLDSNQEVHFIPEEELLNDTTYQLSLTGVRSFAFTRLREKPFSFYNPPDKSVLAVANLKPQRLPLSQKALFKKSNGELVEINQPQILQGKYIDIDLSKMILTTFDNSQSIATYEVAAAGSPWGWATPMGNFKVLHKEKNHFSRKTYVWMPWSIHFYGDYYIHEIPYWPNGQRLTSKYSGGCIRLPIDSAELVYNWADIGTLIFIH